MKKKLKFEHAPIIQVEKLAPYMDKILKALGHPEAFATDESYISDFLDIFDKEEGAKTLTKAEKKLKIKMGRSELVISVANRLQGRDWGIQAAKKLKKIK